MDPLAFIFYFLIVIPSAIIHEYAHGWTADQLGDPTARYAGRLTLDPRAHIDPWGTLLLPLLLWFGTGGRFLFAYAKPVPFNPYNLRLPRWGPALVGLAGPLANLLLAASFAIVLRLLPATTFSAFLRIIVHINVVLMIFNLVPIPPLDGSKVLYALLPDSAHQFKLTLERYGFWLLLIFVFFLFDLIAPLIDGLFRLLVG
ncbi:MAG: site-2 protease family protein [Candidatus Magasanikbacteria bacterium]|nr:site-2 protease family protein [Candidatus Magasanikbacteria bacterium]